MKFIILVSTVITDENNKVLLVLEKKEKIKNKLNLPGGHLEFGETLVQGALREVKEEVLVDIILKGLIGIYTGKSDNQYFHYVFSGKIIKGTVKTNINEINGVKWHSVDKLDEIADNKLVSPIKFRKIMKDFQLGKLCNLDLMQDMVVEI